MNAFKKILLAFLFAYAMALFGGVINAYLTVRNTLWKDSVPFFQYQNVERMSDPSDKEKKIKRY
jgi:hypothetical protein